MNSFIGWIGGKRLLRKTIAENFPEEKTERYVEVFGGAGWVLFYKEKHAAQEIYNDYNSDLVNLFRCVKYHYEELQRELQYILNSRETFKDFKTQYQIRGMTDIQRAARYYYLIKMSYGSDVKTYGSKNNNISNMREILEKTSRRLNNVVIENKDFEELIKQYAKKGTLFYLDPPYLGTENYYQGFRKEDHLRLKDALEKISGKFLLSYNDCPEIRELYKEYEIICLTRNDSLLNRYEVKDYKEILIRNY